MKQGAVSDLSWAKHNAAQFWCSVLVIAGGSVQTRCRGRWSVKELYVTAARPPVAERCVACQGLYAAAQLDALAASCGDLSQRHAIELGLRELRLEAL